MSTFPERLYKLRKEKKLARDALGAKIGVSKTAIKNWEDGENMPKVEHVQALAKYFDVSFDWLATGEGEMIGTQIAYKGTLADYEPSTSTVELVETLKEMERNGELTPQLVGLLNATLDTVKSASGKKLSVAHLVESPNE